MKNICITGLTILCFMTFGNLQSFAQTKNALQKKETPKKPYYPKGFRLGFGLSSGLPTDSDYEAALGGDVRLQYDLSRKTSLTATSGYTHFFQKGADIGFIPAKLGFKAFWGTKFYAQGEVGAAFGVNGDISNSPILAPTFGYATKYFDISLRYENYIEYKTDQIGIRLAYGFSLKK
nr:hypothetical protein [uncultured Flavobacterium sp.]